MKKKIIVCIISVLCAFALAACAAARDPQEKYVAYEIGEVTIMQNSPESYEFRVQAQDAEKIVISRSDKLTGNESSIPFTQENGLCIFDCALAEGDYFLYVTGGGKTAVLPFTVPKMQPRLVRNGNVAQILFEVDGGTSWSSFIDPNGKNVYKSANNVFDESAVAVSENISITTTSVNDRNYDAATPYYYIVFDGKNGQMTYVSSAVCEFETEFTSVSASISAANGGAVLTVTGTAANGGYVAAAHSASGELILGEIPCEAGEFTLTCDLSGMTEAGIWYDVRLYNLYTGQRFDLPATSAATQEEVEAGERTYSFQNYEDLLKITFAAERGDAADKIDGLSLSLSVEDNKPLLTITGKADADDVISAEIRTDNAAVVSAKDEGDGTQVYVQLDLSALTVAGRWYDIILTVDGVEYDVFESTASTEGQISANGHIYNFQDWEGVVKVACDPTE